MTPCPSNFPEERQKNEVAYQFLDASEGDDSAEGSWAQGVSPDGKGQFSYARLQALSDDTGDLSPILPASTARRPAGARYGGRETGLRTARRPSA